MTKARVPLRKNSDPHPTRTGFPTHRTRAKLFEIGKSLREKCPRKSHASWEVPDDRRDVLDLMRDSSKGRIPELIPIRHGRMLKSPFTWYRGSAMSMAADLAGTPVSGLRVQACGDAHLCNFGVYATPERRVIFDINDLDETLPAPWEWDVKRLAASFVLACRDNGFRDDQARDAALAYVRSYREHMAEFADMRVLDVWYSSIDVKQLWSKVDDPETRRRARKRLKKASSRNVLEDDYPELVAADGLTPTIRENRPLIYHWREVGRKEHMANVRKAFDAYRETLPEQRRVLLDRYELLDIAVKVVGIGSVGTTCAVMLLMAGEDDPLFLQVKEARASVLEPYAGKSPHANHGRRVVLGCKLMQAASDLFLGWTRGVHGREFIVNGRDDVLNPEKCGTKMAAHYRLTVAPGECRTIRLRLADAAPYAAPEERGNGHGGGPFGDRFDEIFGARRSEADEFYADVSPKSLDADASNVMRQAIAGMLWSKQYYHYDVDKWLEERGSDPFKPTRKAAPRNEHWHHMYNGDVISMPDKWEYPWYAAWDLAFHVLALTLVDPDFGKGQLKLMLRERYMHPNGQIPAYEWNFGDVNPPVHAWSTIFTYRLETAQRGEGDREWLKSSFQKLLLNFTWWVNRKDRTGRNVFEGGFLGLDNIGVFDRNAPLPTGGYLEQADGTAWMVLFCQNMLEIAAELTLTDPDYGEMALKFLEHFLWIASSMAHLGDDTGMWDEEDGFFYDVLRLPDGRAQRLKVRSMVGLLPLCAATTYDGAVMAKYPELAERFRWFLESRPELYAAIHDPTKLGVAGRRLASILDETKLRRVLAKMLDEGEFLSPYGIRSLSRYHAEHPYVIHAGAQEYRVGYLPAESDTGMFGGNSNWRGPIWMPVNALIIRALLQYYLFYGDEFTVECPTGSGRRMNLYQVAEEISRRLAALFLRGPDGRRPVYGGNRTLQEDPHWRDCLLFYEYFHGDNGAGLGASHQTGWTGVIARLMHLFATLTPELALAGGKASYFDAHVRADAVASPAGS